MATRSIVTSIPDVACDVCGRRLLRGERPDVFLAGGQRRTVCELCVPRAAAGGWLREADSHAMGARPARRGRAGSLLGRLRQLREPVERPMRHEGLPAGGLTGSDDPQEGLYDFLDDGSGELSAAYDPELYGDSADASKPAAAAWQDTSDSAQADTGLLEQPWSEPTADTARAQDAALTAGDLKVARALKVFNAGEPPRRVAGVARSLGAPSVTARALQDSGSMVAIVVAWELCWYRYEVDLGDEAAGACLVAQGMELDELPEEDRLANVAADERGELAPLVEIG
jgi:hypothetical protein